MEHNSYLDPNTGKTGEQLINEQIMESYHSGVIDHDIEKLKENEK